MNNLFDIIEKQNDNIVVEDNKILLGKDILQYAKHIFNEELRSGIVDHFVKNKLKISDGKLYLNGQLSSNDESTLDKHDIYYLNCIIGDAKLCCFVDSIKTKQDSILKKSVNIIQDKNSYISMLRAFVYDVHDFQELQTELQTNENEFFDKLSNPRSNTVHNSKIKTTEQLYCLLQHFKTVHQLFNNYKAHTKTGEKMIQRAYFTLKAQLKQDCGAFVHQFFKYI